MNGDGEKCGGGGGELFCERPERNLAGAGAPAGAGAAGPEPEPVAGADMSFYLV